MVDQEIRFGELRMIQFGGVIPGESSFRIAVDGLFMDKTLIITRIIKETEEDGNRLWHVEAKKMISSDPAGVINGRTKWSEPFIWRTYYKKPDFEENDINKDYINV